MRISRVFATAAIVATFNFSSAQAQTLSQGLVPAEFPPASYQGRQYVDSKGCIFIRAGIDGNVTWVPRVTRSRKAICGFQPTFSRKAPGTKAKTQKVVTAPVTKKNSQKVKVAKAPATKASAAEPAASQRQTACRGGNAVSQKYVGKVGQNVRCGPQKGAAALTRRAKFGGATQKTPRQAEKRFVPLHVHENQLASLPAIKVPKGYKPAWNDDRLNPKRAHQTKSGKAKMDLIWTQTVPRKLIKRNAESR